MKALAWLKRRLEPAEDQDPVRTIPLLREVPPLPDHAPHFVAVYLDVRDVREAIALLPKLENPAKHALGEKAEGILWRVRMALTDALMVRP